MTLQDEASTWIQRLTELGMAVRMKLRERVNIEREDFARPVAEESGDTIYAIDRHVEPVIEAQIAQWPASCLPLVLVAEGMGKEGVRRFGPISEKAKYRLIVDPIDGTRGLMYDKRPAWFLAGVAPELGDATRLSQMFASVMVELPTTKQCDADHFVASSDRSTQGCRIRIDENTSKTLAIRPSAASSIRDGFAQVANFFPGTKLLAAELMERIALRTLGEVRPGRADVFDDQYICTGGQLVELMVGHDRFCCDLRPLFYDILDKRSNQKTPRGIECHPYDLAGLLVAKQAGVIVTDGFGQPIDGPLDVNTGMHWCGYANEQLFKSIQPVILEWLQENGIVSS